MAETVERPTAPDTDLVEYLVVVVPDIEALATLVPALVGLVETSAVRILDLVCVTRSAADGELTVLEYEDVDSLTGLQRVDGDVGGFLSEHDVETASLAVPPGASGLLLLVEGLWARSLATAARRAGGRLVGGEYVDLQRVDGAGRPALPAVDGE
jgi:hypothetical protein